MGGLEEGRWLAFRGVRSDDRVWTLGDDLKNSSASSKPCSLRGTCVGMGRPVRLLGE